MRSRKTTLLLAVFSAIFLVGLAGPAAADWGPPEIAVQGKLTNLAGEPVEGPVWLTFSIYDGVDGAVAIWQENHVGVQLEAGRFQLLLGSTNPLDDPPIFETFDSLWVGIAVEGGKELPRAPLASVGYAMQARHAEFCDKLAGAPGDLDCDGCVGTADIADGGVTLADLAGAGCLPGQLLKRSGDGTAWVCADDLDTGYGAGFAITFNDGNINVDKGSLDAMYVEEDQEDAISNEMLVDGAVSDAKIMDVSWAKLVGIPEGFADGIDDGLLVEEDPEVGILEAGKWCTSDGGLVNCTADEPTQEEADPQVGDNEEDFVPKWDGEALVKGSIEDAADEVVFSSKLNMDDNRIENVALPTAEGDAATKAYVDSSISTPSLMGRKYSYTVVMPMRSDTYCPQGWTVEDFDALQGPNGYLYTNINSQGLFMGGMNSLGYGNHQLYGRIHVNGGITKICSKTFTSSSGWPHSSVFVFHGGNQASCPAGYHYIPKSEISGNNNHAHMMSNDAGLYLGYIDDWSYTAHSHQDDSGYQRRNWTSEVTTICLKVMGVDEDPDTANGVFPVFLGLKDANHCPNGWETKPVSSIDGTNGYTYIQMNDNNTTIGGIGDWDHGGNNYQQVHMHYSHVGHICWKYFTRTSSNPYYQIRTPHSGACANGYMQFPASTLKANDNNGRIQSTGHGLYMGGMHSWGAHDYSHGFVQHTFSSEVNNNVCLKIQNAQ